MSNPPSRKPLAMTPEQWSVIAPLIDEGRDLDPQHRAAFYERIASAGSDVAAQVERLVAECERQDSHFDNGAAVQFASLFDDGDDFLSQLRQALGSAYDIERELGGSGMSRVFLARETGLGRRLVIKVLAPHLAAGISAERFERETRLAATLQQANIKVVVRNADGTYGEIDAKGPAQRMVANPIFPPDTGNGWWCY